MKSRVHDRPILSILCCVALAAYACTAASVAQCNQRWLPEPGSEAGSLGVDGSINCYVELPGGDVIVGGQFTRAGGLDINNIARYNPTTETWSPLGTGITNAANPCIVFAACLMSNGDLVAGGSFSHAGGVPASSIARYNFSTGTWSAMGSGVTGGSVLSLLAEPGNSVLVGGSFSAAGGVNLTKGIARFLSSNEWNSVGLGIETFNSVPFIDAMAYDTAGDLYIHDANSLAVNQAFRRRPHCTSPPFCGLIAFSNFYIGYTPVLGQPGSIIPLPNGNTLLIAPGTPTGGNSSLWSPSGNSFSPLGFGVNDVIHSMVPTSQGDMIAVGDFTMSGTTLVNHIARYNPTSNAWTPLATLGETSVPTSAIALTNGDVLVSGSLNRFGMPRRIFMTDNIACSGNMARYEAASSKWKVSFGVDGPINAAVRLPGGDIIVGGQFTRARGINASYIARYNPTTGAWSALGSGTNNTVNALTLLPSGDVVAGGSFTNAGGVAVSRVARYSPATGTWSSMNATNTNVPTIVYALATLPSGDVAAGGSNSTNTRRAVRWNAATNTWITLGAIGSGGAQGVGHEVRALAAYPNGDLFIGGSFPDPVLDTGNFRHWHAATNTLTAPGIGTDGVINALTVAPDGKVILGGEFLAAGPVFSPRLARWDPGTSTWSGFSIYPNNTVKALAMRDDGFMILGGDFTQVSDVEAPRIALVRPDVETWAHNQLGELGNVDITIGGSTANAFAVAPGGEFFVGGSFHIAISAVSTQVFDVYYNNFGHWGCPPVVGCDSIDFNGDGLFPDTTDIDDFLSVFSGGPCSTGTCGDIDFNNDGLYPDTTDIDTLLLVFSGGAC